MVKSSRGPRVQGARALTPKGSTWPEFGRRLSSLGEGIGPPEVNRCDGTFRRALEIVRDMGFDRPACEAYWRRNGAGCDCEILLNVGIRPETHRQALRRLRADYGRSRDGLSAWGAVLHAHWAKVPLPDWCMEYLVRAAAALHQVRHAQRGARPLAVVHALGLAQGFDVEPRGPGRPAESKARDLSLAWALYAERAERGTSHQVALATVAAQAGCSESTVKRAWTLFREEVLADGD